MSILICGMEMPNNDSCITIRIFSTGRVAMLVGGVGAEEEKNDK